MIYWAKDNCGIKLNSHDDHFNAAIISKIPDEIDTIIFTPGELNNLSKYITLLKIVNVVLFLRLSPPIRRNWDNS